MDLTKLKDYILQKDFYKRLFIILIGTYLLALDYNLFLLPNHFVIGGTSGLAIILKIQKYQLLVVCFILLWLVLRHLLLIF